MELLYYRFTERALCTSKTLCYNPHMENTTEEKTKLSTPMAIVLAGFLIMIGILLTKHNNGATSTSTGGKTLSEQVGVSQKDMAQCVKDTDNSALNDRINASVGKAMSNVADGQRGTPYTIVIGKDGVKTEILGANSYENTKKVIDDALIGKVATPYTGNVELSEPTDHISGNANATVTIIEYSDFECPYCKQFHPTLERIIKESNGNVKWIYRHYPLHQHSFSMLVAAECVAKLKGEDAFWKYGDLLFSLQDPQDTISGKL
jgi:hypothetical protein